jgi:hypothetical protein
MKLLILVLNQFPFIMRLEHKLDLYLRYYKKNRKHNDPEYQKLAQDVGEEDLRSSLDKLYEDQLLTDKILEDSKKITYLSVKGKVFLRRGGYRAQRLRETSVLWYKVISSLIMIGATASVPILMCQQSKEQNKAKYEESIKNHLIEAIGKRIHKEKSR